MTTGMGDVPRNGKEDLLGLIPDGYKIVAADVSWAPDTDSTCVMFPDEGEDGVNKVLAFLDKNYKPGYAGCVVRGTIWLEDPFGFKCWISDAEYDGQYWLALYEMPNMPDREDFEIKEVLVRKIEN